MKRLEGLHHDLICIVMQAAAISPVQFVITEGLRSIAEQRAKVAAGKSQTMLSRHITGHAIDFAPIVEGKADYSWATIFQVVDAFREAAEELGHPIRWGGCWQIMNAPAQEMFDEYVESKRQLHEKPFLDGVHIELPAALYPAVAK